MVEVTANDSRIVITESRELHEKKKNDMRSFRAGEVHVCLCVYVYMK